MKVLVTGSKGFLATNLILRLKELKSCEVLEIYRETTQEEALRLISQADFIFHLAGVNRPNEESEYHAGNVALTKTLVDTVKNTGRNIPVVYSSSVQADLDNPYGLSKRKAEEIILSLGAGRGFVCRLPNVFGKWSRPNYNSVVATFCYNTANDLPHRINDDSAVVNLVYVDDVVDSFLATLRSVPLDSQYLIVQPIYSITVGQLSKKIQAFKESRETLVTEDVGIGLTRALYSTYLSFLSPEQFSYDLKKHQDPRGNFCEVLKTKSSGQFSFFTAHPGVTRGGHYHHTKTEKFVVVQGRAKYRFKHMVTGATYDLEVDSRQEFKVVETIPGWAHDITNIGNDELIVMLWANEIFDQQKPDTIGCSGYL